LLLRCKKTTPISSLVGWRRCHWTVTKL